MSSSHSAGSGSVTSFTVLPVPFHSSDAVGPGCTRDLKNCNGNGDCNYCSGTCSCYDGYGSAKDKAVAQSPTFNPDCSSKACPIGIALAMVSKSGKSLHKKVECSNNGHAFLFIVLSQLYIIILHRFRIVLLGICHRNTGTCFCFTGYSGEVIKYCSITQKKTYIFFIISIFCFYFPFFL
jgi:hypothetical protein